MAVELSKKARKAFGDLELLGNEEMLHVFEADGFFIGTNPMAKALAVLMAFIVKITGGHIRIFLVITDMRVLMVQSQAQWCGCMKVKGTNTFALSGIKEAGISKETQYCCIHTRLLHVESLTQRHTMVVKKFKDADLNNFLRVLSTVIINNSRTV